MDSINRLRVSGSRPFLGVLLCACAVIVLAFPLGTSAATAEELWSITPEPTWGSQATGDNPVMRAKGGKYYHLSERQHRFGRGPQDFASYLRYMYTITNGSGLEDGSYLMIDFDPEYETVQLHKVLVHRGNETIDLLEKDKDKIQLLQRETELDDNLYNGEQSLYLVLDDQRVGDKVEISYTLRGRNPVFKSKVFGWGYLQSSVSVGNYYFSINYPQHRDVKARVFAGDVEPVVTHSEGFTQQTWDAHNVPGKAYQSNVPYTHQAQTLVQYSEFDSWSEVAEWLQPLYEPTAVADDLIVSKVDEIRAKWPTQEEQVAAAVQFVQDKIRYTGINSGIGGWVPDDTHTILQRRFGDCKDKSVLLTALLRELGVDAYPVLVDTNEGAVLSKYLPIVSVFNHMIVHIPDFDGKSYWVDPTRTLQGTGLDSLAQGYYHNALIPAVPERGLVSYTRPLPKIAHKSVLEKYRLRDSGEGKSSILHITTTLWGHSAEHMRRSIEENGIEGLEQDYLEYYQNRFDDIAIAKSLQIEDDRRKNVLILVERYRIDNAWQQAEDESDESKTKFELYAYADAVTERFSLPKDKRRHQPLYQPHPLFVEHKLRLTDDSGWDFKDDVETISNDYLEFTRSRRVRGRTIEIDFLAKTRGASVSVEDSRRYIKDLRKLLDKGYFYATYSKKTPSVSKVDRQLLSIGRWFSETTKQLNGQSANSTSQ